MQPFRLTRLQPCDHRAVPRTAALVDAWLEELDARRSRRTGHLAAASNAALRRGIRPWLRYLADEERSDAPGAASVEDFVAHIGRTHRAATVALYLSAVRSLYRWAAAQDLHPDIAGDVPAGGGAPADAPLPPLDDAAYARLRRSIAGDDLRSHRDRALLACLRAVPVETIAWARARVGAVDFDTQSVQLAPRGLPSAWRRGRAEAPTRRFRLDAEAVSRLHTYLQRRGPARDSAPLFISTRGGQALSTLTMRLTVLRCLEASGLRAPAGGVARNRLLYRYPAVGSGDLASAERHLPADGAERTRARALLHLLALPGLRIAWERLAWSAVDTRRSRLVVQRRTRGGTLHVRTIPLSTAACTALRAWRGANAGPLVFGDATGRPISHHTLKRIAWAVFPGRLPSNAPPAVGSSSRRLPRATLRGRDVPGRRTPGSSTRPRG